MEKKYMEIAIEEAKKSLKSGDVPVGAVIIKNGKIISKGHNTKEKEMNVLKHAEINAIDKACRKLKSWRLDGCDIYITLEPCAMCAGAIVNSRISRAIISTESEKSGYAGSLGNILGNKNGNHITVVEFGMMKKTSEKLLKNFFKDKRK